MGIQTILVCSLILIGAIILLISIVRAKELQKALLFVSKRQRKHLLRHLMLHRGLMVFFFFGYLLVLAAIALRYSLTSEIILSLILFFGAIYVFIGITVQSRLLAEVQHTLHGILPICAKCKKIRIKDGDYKDPLAWKKMEIYISERADVDFTHGLCPECFEDQIRDLDRIKWRAA